MYPKKQIRLTNSCIILTNAGAIRTIKTLTQGYFIDVDNCTYI